MNSLNERIQEFERRLAFLLNEYGFDTALGTSDRILASHILGELAILSATLEMRQQQRQREESEA